jgi:Tfp pilus assembly protein PilX
MLSKSLTSIRKSEIVPQSRSYGFVTLMVILTLLIGLTTVSLMSGRSSSLEQLIAGNDSRSTEVKEAAEATLEYCAAWTNTNSIPWESSTDNLLDCPADTNCPVISSSFHGGDAGEISLTFRFERNPSSPKFIKISATASQTENNSQATYSEWIDQTGSRIPGTWKDF